VQHDRQVGGSRPWRVPGNYPEGPTRDPKSAHNVDPLGRAIQTIVSVSGSMALFSGLCTKAVDLVAFVELLLLAPRFGLVI